MTPLVDLFFSASQFRLDLFTRMDKYEGLPDIGAGPDVFETSSVESNGEVGVEEDPNVDIDTQGGDLAQARGRFTHEIVDEIDFLRSITRLGGMKARHVNETTDEKIARIRREIEELRLEEALPVEETASLLQSIKDHPTRLNAYHENVRTVFEQIKADFAKTKQEIASGQSKDLDVLNFEARMNAIETALGPIPEASNTSIQNHLNDLSRKVNIIYNPEFELPKIKLLIQEINKETEKLATNRKLAQFSNPDVELPDASDKIGALYAKLDDFDRVNATVPGLLSRLRSLHRIHADLGIAVSSIGTIDTTLASLKDDMRKWNESLNSINASLDSHNQTFETNRAALEERFKALE